MKQSPLIWNRQDHIENKTIPSRSIRLLRQPHKSPNLPKPVGLASVIKPTRSWWIRLAHVSPRFKKIGDARSPTLQLSMIVCYLASNSFFLIIRVMPASCPLKMRPHFLSRTRQFNAPRTFTTSTRFFSADPPASSIASSFLSRFQTSGPQTRTQTLDANQLQLLTLTLNRPSLFPGSPSLSNAPNAPPPDTPVPPGYHLVYFTPDFLEGELGADGTDASYNPESPFTRRMWAGGEVLWPRGADGKPNSLRVGQEVRETTRVLSAEPKVVKKTGEDMIVVGVEKEFSNEHGVAIIDRRWIECLSFLHYSPNPDTTVQC
jgi:hypothetical protein